MSAPLNTETVPVRRSVLPFTSEVYGGSSRSASRRIWFTAVLCTMMRMLWLTRTGQGPVHPMKLQSRLRRVELQIERRRLGGPLLLARQLAHA